MKLALVLTSFFAASFSHAAAPACGSIVSCGSYVQGPDSDGDSLEVDFLATDTPDELNFAWTYFKNGVDINTGVKLTMKFQDDGTFVAKREGQVYAAGACRQLACTYGIIPFSAKNGAPRMQTGTFLFGDKSLDLSIYSPSDAGDDFVSKGTLTKK